MKQFFRFAMVTLVAMMTSVSVWAAWPDKPTPKYSELTAGVDVYLYNIGSGRYLYWGQAWGTQACLGEQGFYYQAETVSEGVYKLKCTDPGMTKGNKYLRRINTDGTAGNTKTAFVDQAGANIEWEIQPVAENVYTIAPPQSDERDYVEGEYFGFNNDHAQGSENYAPNWGLYYDIPYADYPTHCQWAFVLKEDYENLANFTSLYNALQSAITDGVAEADLAEEIAVFDNPDATLEQINAAIASATEKKNQVRNWETCTIDDYIVNPDFKSGVAPWQRTMTAQNNQLKTGSYSDPGDYTLPFYENWNPSANNTVVGKMYQVVDGLPAGTYRAKLSVFVNNFNPKNATECTQYFYAKAGENDAVKVPLTQSLFKSYSALVDVAAGESFEMGFEQTSQTANWMGIDNAALLYYGNSAESMMRLSRDLSENWEDEFSNDLYFQQYYDAVEDLVNGIDDIADYESGRQAASDLLAAIDALRENVSVSTKFYDKANEMEGKRSANNLTYEPFIEALDQAFEWQDALDGGDVTETTTADVQAWLDGIDQLYEEAMDDKLENPDPGTEFSYKLKNPDFTEDINNPLKNWTVVNKGNTGWFSSCHRVLECWNSNFDFYQEFTIPATGSWRVLTHGFYRTGSSGDAMSRWNAANGADEGDNKVCAFLYADNIAEPFPNWCKNPQPEKVVNATNDEDNQYGYKALFGENWASIAPSAGGTLSTPKDDNNKADFVKVDTAWYSNGVYSASYCFEHPDLEESYRAQIDFLGEKGQVVKFGMKAENILSEGWTIFDDMKLFFMGNDPDVIAPVLQKVLASVAELNARPKEAAAQTQLATAIANATSAYAADPRDGDEMMAAYLALNDAIGVATESANKYEPYVEAKEKLDAAITKYENSATAEAKSEATAEQTFLANGLTNGTLSVDSAAVAEEQAKVESLVKKLAVPDVTGGDYPYDFTGVIVNPLFKEGSDNLNGWTVTSAKEDESAGIDCGVERHTTSRLGDIGIGQGWSNGAYSFDYNQVLEGLPEGVYELWCQGAFRYCDNARADSLLKKNEYYPLLEANPDSCSWLYANGDEVLFNSLYKAPESVADLDIFMSAGDGAYYAFSFINEFDEETTYQIPNNRQAFAYRASQAIHDADGEEVVGQLWHEMKVVCYVDESGELSFGFKNAAARPNGWTIATNFKLLYFGPDDPRKEETGINEVNNTVVGNKAIYTIDGRQTNKLVKGINIVKQEVNGKTVVKKVIVK